MNYVNTFLSKEKEMNEENFKIFLKNSILRLEDEYKDRLDINLRSYDLYSKYYKNRLISLKKYTNKTKLKNIKKAIDSLQREYDVRYNTEGYKYNNFLFDIIRFDHKYNIDVYDTFNKIKFEEDIYVKRRLLLNVQKIYTDLFSTVFKVENRSGKYGIHNIKVFFKEKSLETKRKIEKRKKEIREKEKLNNKYIERPVVDYDKYLNQSFINDSSVDNLISIIKNIIKNNKISIKLIDFIKLVVEKISLDDDKDYEKLYSVIDSIKNRKLITDDKRETKILSICSSYINNHIDIVELSKPIEEKHDYKFDLIFELLKSKDNYRAIKKLVNEYPQILNIRNNKKSIVIYILMLYINNYTSIINDHKYYYNIDYLKEVYKLFLKKPGLYLSDEETIEIRNIIDRFIDSLADNNISSKRKNYIINDLKELYVESARSEKDYHKQIDKNIFDYDCSELKFLDPNHTNRRNEKDLTKEHTFMLNDEFTCYSFSTENGVRHLKIHTPDISNVAYDGSMLNNYFYNCLIDGKNIKGDLLSYLKFKEGEDVSAFTYEITFDEKSRIKDFNMYRSKIKINGNILDYYSNQEIYQEIRKVVKDYEANNKVDIGYNGLMKIEYVFNELLKQGYINKINRNKLPKIASKRTIDNVVSLGTLSDLTNIFNKLSKEEYGIIRYILCSPLDETYYTDDIPYKDTHNLHLTGIPDYITLLNQRMVKELLHNEMYNPKAYDSLKEQYEQEFLRLIDILNNNLDYKKEEDFNFKLRRNFKNYKLKRIEETNK